MTETKAWIFFDSHDTFFLQSKERWITCIPNLTDLKSISNLKITIRLSYTKKKTSVDIFQNCQGKVSEMATPDDSGNN